MEKISVEIWLKDGESHLGAPYHREFAFLPRQGEFISLSDRGVSGVVQRVEYREHAPHEGLHVRIHVQSQAF